MVTGIATEPVTSGRQQHDKNRNGRNTEPVRYGNSPELRLQRPYQQLRGADHHGSVLIFFRSFSSVFPSFYCRCLHCSDVLWSLRYPFPLKPAVQAGTCAGNVAVGELYPGLPPPHDLHGLPRPFCCGSGTSRSCYFRRHRYCPGYGLLCVGRAVLQEHVVRAPRG